VLAVTVPIAIAGVSAQLQLEHFVSLDVVVIENRDSDRHIFMVSFDPSEATSASGEVEVVRGFAVRVYFDP
jgi:hypothetical protein